MTYEDAKFCCHVRSAIHRASKPETLFWKNMQTPLDERVPDSWKTADDWQEYDPREEAYEALA